MKVRDVAERLGWSSEKVYRFERGEQVPDAIELAALAALHRQPYEFFFGTTSADGGAEVLTGFGEQVNGR